MVEENKLEHVAFSINGNRRWAKQNGKSSKEGHESGAEKVSDTINWCIEYGIKYATFFTFSTENWKRDPEEVNNLMNLLRRYLNSKEDEFMEKKVKIKVIGVEDRVDRDIMDSIRKIEEKTKNNDVIQVNMAFNYGGRREILDTVKKISRQVKDGLMEVEDIDDGVFRANLYYGDKVPDPDLIIRTGGEYRVSNFLLWEMAYSEFYFTDIFWPDFSRELFGDIINNFKKRERKYGGTIKK